MSGKLRIVDGVPSAVADGATILSFAALRERFRSWRAVRELGAYGEVELHVGSVDAVARPFRKGVLLRLLSRGRCAFTDVTGNRRSITLTELARMFGGMLRDGRRAAGLRRDLADRVEQLAAERRPRTLRVDRRGPPVYLRTDLIFGVAAGGSVGHIAGVVNHWHDVFSPPVFCTTAEIPTVRDDVETHYVRPLGLPWDQAELPQLAFNEVFAAGVRQAIGTRRPAFIYHRYCLNDFSSVVLAREYGVSLVLEFNGSEVWVQRNWGTPLKYEVIATCIERLNLDAADLIVVVSDVMRDQLVAEGVPADKILVNPNGVDTHVYRPDVDGAEIRRRYELTDKLVVGFIGTFGRWHGTTTLATAFVRAIERRPEYRGRVRLLMIGDGLMMPETRQILREAGLESHAVFTGLVPQAQGPQHLAACDILTSPQVPNADGSRFFGSPTKLFEYMAMGKAIIASDLDQLGQVLDHERTAWLAKPGDVDSLCDGLLKLWDDAALRDRLGRAARAEAVDLHSWRRHTERIVAALEVVADVA